MSDLDRVHGGHVQSLRPAASRPADTRLFFARRFPEKFFGSMAVQLTAERAGYAAMIRRGAA